MTDLAAARRNMVDGQIRTADVTDQRLIGAMLDVPRELFVPQEMAALAYLDREVAAGAGGERRLLRPMVLAKLIQAADIQPADRVLVVGASSGYAAAIVARLGGEVFALEQDITLARQAGDTLRAQPNVTVVTGELAYGWAAAAPYNAIVIEGATEIVPQALCDQLSASGRLVCVLGSGPAGKATLFRRSGEEVGSRAIFDAAAPLLPGFAKPAAFVF